MDNNKNIIDFWPFSYAPRQNQVDALNWLAAQEAKYLILEAPVGTGKSNIGITYSMYAGQNAKMKQGDSFILTPQRILQEQYETSFRNVPAINLASLYGKSNYTCISKNASCEVGSVIKPRCKDCPHTKAKKAAQNAANTVLNYKLALTSFAYTETFGRRKLMVLDECHTLENHLVDFDALQITEHRCKKSNLPFKVFNDLKEAHEWVREVYYPRVSDVLKDMEADCEALYDKSGSDLSRAEVKQLQDFDAFTDHVEETQMIAVRTFEYMEENYVLTWDKFGFQFKRLTGEYTFKKIMEPFADKFLFMSSTVLDKDGFCRDLGIDPKDAAFMSLDSEFPTENRPVYYMPQTKMNYGWNQPSNAKGRKQMIATIKQLLEMHDGQSGIIHTGNFAVAEWLVDMLEGEIKQKIFHHNPSSNDDRNSIIRAFISSPKASVLISPSSTEGLDLKEDLGRFAIFAKVPFGSMGDQWIKRRMELSAEWYARRALIDMIQGGGRVVRSESDSGSVYILDGSFAMLYKNSGYMIPKWWKEAYHVV